MVEYNFPYLEGNFGSSEIRQKKPLTLKPHHISEFYSIFIDLALYPPEASGEMNPQLVTWLHLVVEAMSKDELPTDWFGNSFMSYGKDVAGETESQKELYYQRLLDMHKLFLALPDDYPVLVQTTGKDIICKACIVGKHCDLPIDDGVIEGENDDAMLYIGLVRDHTELKMGEPNRWWTRKTRPNQRVEEYVVETNIGTMKKVFAYYRENIRRDDNNRIFGNH